MSQASTWLYTLVFSSVIAAFAAGLAAYANVEYQRAREDERQSQNAAREAQRDQAALDREAEKSQALSRSARTVLKPEVEENLALVASMLTQIGVDRVPTDRLQLSAWQTVASGEFVRGFNADEIAKLATAYELATRVNANLDRLTDLKIGESSALVEAAKNRKAVAAATASFLHRLHAALSNVQNVVE